MNLHGERLQIHLLKYLKMKFKGMMRGELIMSFEEKIIGLYKHLPVWTQDVVYRFAYLTHLEPHHEYVQIILDTWKDKEPNDPELIEALRYLEVTRSYRFIPYEFTKKYQKITTRAKKYDGFPAILVDGKTLYFPKSFGCPWASGYYRCLMTELDNESPHRYFSKTFPEPFENEILLDVGAAEAVISLQYIEKVKHVFIFECDENWIEALHKTFEPYKDKVTIVNKYVSDKNEGNSINLDSFILNYYGENGFNEHFMAKVDIEGAEASMLRGCKRLIDNKNSRFAIATYHKSNDSTEFKQLFDEYGYKTELSPKYVLYGGRYSLFEKMCYTFMVRIIKLRRLFLTNKSEYEI